MADLAKKVVSCSLMTNMFRRSVIPMQRLIVVPASHASTKSPRHHVDRPVKLIDERVNYLYEDPALNTIKERQEYPDVWLHIKGYDFAVVESYLTFLQKFLNSMDFQFEQICVPPRQWVIQNFKPKSEIEDSKYALKMAHRLVKLQNVPNNALSLIIDMASRHLPAGISLSVEEADEELNEFLYVPDGDVKALQEAVNEIDNPRLKKRR